MIGTQIAKKRKIQPRKVTPVVKRKPPTLEELRKKPSGTVPMWCLWCYTEKTSTNHRCANCGSYGTTSTPQSSVSHVYVEDIPQAS